MTGMVDLDATRAHAESPGLPPGTQVGRYVVAAPLGEGGMGVVYVAFDPELDRKVALKLLRHEGVWGDEELLAGRTRLHREAQALARLAHPNVVAIYDVGTFGDRLFLAMELVEGQHLAAWLKAAPRSWPEILDVFLAAGDGLAAAHQAGLLHRDFKLENVILGQDGRVRVLDFGLARPIHEQLPLSEALAAEEGTGVTNTPFSAELTTTGQLVGTPAYLAPELVHGQPPSPASDQYAFCVALYRALYGRPPLEGANLLELLQAIGSGRALQFPPRGAVGPLPAFLRQALARGLEREPERRFADFGALLRFLRQGRRRQTLLRQLVVASGAVAMIGLVTLPLWRASDACAEAGAAADALWSADQRRELALQFQSAASPFAAATWTAAEAAIDDWIGEWREQSAASCRATFRDRHQGEKLFELRKTCLDRSLGELAGLIGIWRQGDEASLVQARTSVSGLRDLDACVDGRTLLGVVEPPAASRPEVDQLRERLADLATLKRATHYRTAYERLPTLLEASRTLGYAPLLADVESLYGDLAEELGQYEEARRAYFRSLVAAKRGRDAETAFHAARSLGWVEGLRLERVEEGAEWADLSAAWLEDLGPRPFLEMSQLDLRATLAYTRGNFAEAEKLYRQTWAMIESWPGGRRDPYSANVLSRIGLALESQERFDEAFDFQSRALQRSQEIFGPGHPEGAYIRRSLGTLLLQQGLYHEAIETNQAVYEQITGLLGSDHPEAGVALHNIGVAYELLGELDKSVPYYRGFLEATRRHFGPVHGFTVRAGRNLGIALMRLGDLKEPRRLFEVARDAAAKLGPSGFREEALTWAALSELEMAANRPPQALAAIDRAFLLLDDRITPSERAVGTFIRARALWQNGSRREGVAAAREALVALDAQRLPEAEDARAWLAEHGGPPGR